MDPLFTRVPIFAGLSPAALEVLERLGKRLATPAGGAIVREGQPGNELYIIAAGSARVVKHAQGPHPVILAQLGPGDFFGEMCILETLPRSATVEGMTDAELLVLSSGAFYRLYQQMPEQYSILVLNIARDLSRRLRRLDDAYAARM